MIDRIGPTRCPAGKPVGWQQWRSLLFMHWSVDPGRIEPLLPAGLELDLLDGRAHVGIVPFLMQAVRPFRWWPRIAAFRFLETNVRIYVRHNDEPGVMFFSLDASSRLAVLAARRIWGLPYFHADMRCGSDGDTHHYSSARRRHGPGLRVSYRTGDSLGPSAEGSPEFFFLERYLLFVEREGVIWRGQVHHSPYPAHAAEIVEVHDELVAAAGLGPCKGQPEFAHYSPGVDVQIFPLQRQARL